MIKKQCKLVEDRLLEIFKKENEVNSTNDVSNVIIQNNFSQIIGSTSITKFIYNDSNKQLNDINSASLSESEFLFKSFNKIILNILFKK